MADVPGWLRLAVNEQIDGCVPVDAHDDAVALGDHDRSVVGHRGGLEVIGAVIDQEPVVPHAHRYASHQFGDPGAVGGFGMAQDHPRRWGLRRADEAELPGSGRGGRDEAGGVVLWPTSNAAAEGGSVRWAVVQATRLTYPACVKREQMTTRRATASVAPILAELELRQPSVVTADLMADVVAVAGSHLATDAAVERLVRNGWLFPLRTQGAWEFIPASRAGRYPSGDPWIELHALLSRRPGAPVAVAFASAVWELGFSSHQPSRPTFAHRRGWRAPRALGAARSVSYDWHLPTWEKDGLPIWHPATVVVAVADRPDAQDDWGNADDWLPETMRATTPTDVLTEARDRGPATLARLAYFAEWSGRDDIVEALTPLMPERLSVTFLGSRDPRGRWIKRWKLYDALLPAR